jgi:hypothetical protein
VKPATTLNNVKGRNLHHPPIRKDLLHDPNDILVARIIE